MHLRTKSLDLIPVTREQTMEMVEAMSPSEKAQVSADWLSQLKASSPDRSLGTRVLAGPHRNHHGRWDLRIQGASR